MSWTNHECITFAGFLKPGAPSRRREELKALLGRSCATAGPVALDEGKSSVVLMQGTSKVKRLSTGGCGGLCLVSTGGAGGAAMATGDVIASVEAMSGSFAFADVSDERVVLARDFAGAQSVYFFLLDGFFIFASSLTWFRELSLEVSRQAAADFLHFLYIPAPATIYKGVEAVLPGEAVIFDGTKVEKKPLQRRRAELAPGAAMSPDDYLADYERHLEESMAAACPAGAVAALLLSGGKDSSSLAVAARGAGVGNIEAVTLGFEDAALDETEDARAVADHLGIPFTPLKIKSEEYSELLPGYSACLGQPLGDGAAMPLYAAMKRLGGRHDLLIDGTGNDRYFGVPTTWQEDVAWQAHRSLPGLDRLPWGVLASGLSYSLDAISRSLARRREEQFVSWKGFSAEELETLTGLRPDWAGRGVYRVYGASRTAMDHKTRTICEIWEPETAYRKAVQIANFHGKSVRYPFLDPALMGYSEALPEELKASKRKNKVIVRMLLDKKLPGSVLNKKKGAFVFPKGHILDANGFGHIKSLLSREALLRHGLVDPNMAEALGQGYMKGDKALQDRIWALLLLQAWMEYGR